LRADRRIIAMAIVEKTILGARLDATLADRHAERPKPACLIL
jgi:hypothetical protein